MSPAQQAHPAGGVLDGRPGTITLVEIGEAIVALDFEGEFDVAGAPEITDLATRLIGEGKNLIMNLGSATFIDSAIVHALFDADTDARAHGRSVVLQLAAAPGVARVLSITAADRTLATARTRRQAIELLGAGR